MPRWISVLLGGVPGESTSEERLPLIDQRGIPTHACLACGSNVLIIRATFEDYEIAGYYLDAECAQCGSPLTAPCPVDRPTGQS
jgi:rRNA maturation endonuclease Nob1